MKRDEWKARVLSMTEGVGTYKPEFESIIDTLADILEQRDAAYDDFIESGAQTTIIHVSDRGSESIVKNPRLQVWNDLNTQALSFWKELGLTPAGLKKINESSMRGEEKESALEKALRDIGKAESDKKLDGRFEVRREHPKRGKNRVPRVKTGG